MRRALLGAMLLLTGASRAYAQEPPAAPTTDAQAGEDLVSTGVALRKQGRDEDALAAFERAYATRASPRTLAQIALAHQALGRWLEAERELVQALGNADDPWIARNRVYLEESLVAVQSRLGWIDVDANVDGAEIWVDGQLAGRTPLAGPVRVTAGDARVEVRATGYPPIRQRLHIEGNSRTHAAFAFAVHPPPPVTKPETVSLPLVDGARARTRTVGWIALGTAGALALVGVAGVVVREWEAQIYNGDGCAPQAGASRYERCPTNRDVGSAAQTGAAIAFAGAGVAGAVSAFLLLRSAPSAAGSVRQAAVCAPAGLGFACAGTF